MGPVVRDEICACFERVIPQFFITGDPVESLREEAARRWPYRARQPVSGCCARLMTRMLASDAAAVSRSRKRFLEFAHQSARACRGAGSSNIKRRQRIHGLGPAVDVKALQDRRAWDFGPWLRKCRGL